MIKLSLLVADSASASGAASEDTSAESVVEKRSNSRRNCYGHCLLNLRDTQRRRTDDWGFSIKHVKVGWVNAMAYVSA